MKKLFGLLLALVMVFDPALCVPALAAEEPDVLWLNEGVSCSSIHEGLVKVYQGGKYGYVNAAGRVVIPMEYPDLGNFHEGMVKFQKNGKCGYMDKTGKVVIAPQYDHAGDFSEGMAVVGKNGKWGYINKTGKVVVPLAYDRANAFSDGLGRVGKNPYSGFVDKTGKVVIPIQHLWVSDFHDGLARVTTEDFKSGFMNKKGKMVIPQVYTTNSDFSEGLVIVSQNGKTGIIDKTGKVVAPFAELNMLRISEGMVMLSSPQGGKFGTARGFADKTGKVVVEPQYDEAWDFSEGLAAVFNYDDPVSGKGGYIDKTGKLVIPMEYRRVGSFSEGLAAVGKNGLYGYIDKTGKVIIPLQYESAGTFTDGLALVKKGGKHGILKFPTVGGFTDVPVTQYFAEPVQWAVENDITKGTGKTTFSPGSGCTRVQAVTFLWRAAGKPAPGSTDNPFTDVKEGQYYTDAVLWAVENGITKGTSDTTFSPDNNCTRGQIVTFLYRAAGSPPTDGANAFTDAQPGAYYADAVRWAVGKGVTQGTSKTTFSPDDNCTRGQIVTFLYRGRS